MDLFSQSPEAPVLVIGAAGIDIVGRLKSDPRVGTSNPGQIRSSFGGVARNVAENLARLGQPVSLISVIGEDEDGDRLVQGLEAAGVNTAGVLRSARQGTGSYLAVVNPGGDFHFGVDDMRAISELSREHILAHEHLFREASSLFVDANIPKHTLRTVMSLATKARLPISADPTSVILAPRLRPYLNRLTLITPNSSEAAIFCDPNFKVNTRKKALEAAKVLVGMGVQIAIITMAEQGLCYATSETSGYIPAIGTEIVDPTGAGDALSATVIFALLNDIPLDDAVRLGVSAASLTLRYRGAVVPDLSLEKLYDQLVI
ncbi:MAG: carbohydrate kinase family protein [Anaerolineales bacterium]|nr:MAG: carbohydrate kinase family protein [Anaerolineales bacterium]